jgi:hypothetical protein
MLPGCPAAPGLLLAEHLPPPRPPSPSAPTAPPPPPPPTPPRRYQHGSEHAQRLADSLYNLTYKQQYQIFDFGARSQPVLLILDRRDDPVTPLLTQWTYQAMVHELVGVSDNTVKLTSTKVGGRGAGWGGCRYELEVGWDVRVRVRVRV